MRSRLDAVTNLAVIALCVVVGYEVISRRAPGEEHSDPPPRPGPPMFQAGDKLPSIDGLVLSKSRRTVLVALKTSCGFCEKSVPFYRRLAELRSQDELAFIVVAGEPPDVMSAFLRRSEVRADAVLQVPLSALRVPGTPTLFLVDQQRTLLGVWVGWLPDAKQEEVIAAVAGR